MYHSQNEPVTFTRDCPAVLIPAGERVTLPAGSTGFMTQALGGSFTIYIEGNLFRIAGRDGDAIGSMTVDQHRHAAAHAARQARGADAGLDVHEAGAPLLLDFIGDGIGQGVRSGAFDG